MYLKRALIAVGMLIILSTSASRAELIEKNIGYKQGGETLQGFYVYDDAQSGKRPGALVIHEWWGLNDYAKSRARQLAQMGYAAFAVDMYGGGKNTTDPAEAGKMAGQVRGTPLMRERANAGLDALLSQDNVDPDRVAAIGFCFGGTTVLELAYSGAPLKGVVSFHGGLTAPKPEDLKNIKAKFLIEHGADDPHVSKEAIEETQKGLNEAGADWQMTYHSGAVHAFTNPAAGNDNSKGAAYNENAARRSWRNMQDFFEEIFAE